MIIYINYLFLYRNFLESNVIKLITVIVLIFMAGGCNYSRINERNSELSKVSSQIENTVEIIPTDMSLPYLHTIEDIVIGNPEFDAVEDILKTYGALPYLRQLQAVTLVIPAGSEFDLKTCEHFEALFIESGSTGIVDFFRAHVIDGRYDTADIMSEIGLSGKFKVKSLNKETLTFSSDLNVLNVVSNYDVKSKIKILDQMAINGIVHGIEHWLVLIQNR